MSRLVLSLALAVALSSSLTAAEPKKLAFLVGVSEYLKDGLSNLNYADDDVEELDRVLRGLGFEVEMLVREQAKGAAVRDRFDTFVARTKNELGKSDIVLVVFCGHGIQQDVKRDGKFVTEAFFCPYDAVRTDPATMIAISDVMGALERDSGSSQNLLVIDACRDDPTRGRGLDGSTVERLPAKLSVLFACSANQRSFESSKVEHGVFTQVLLDGLKGEVANKRGEINWIGLAGHVTTEVPLRLPELVPGIRESQQPNLLGNLVLNPVLGIVRPADVPPVMIPPVMIPPANTPTPQTPALPVPANLESTTNSVGMKLILIPAGEFQMGSPASDRDAAGWEKPQHRVRNTKPFYLGQTEVTQAQWQSVMGTTPWSGQTYVKEGPDYPATYVSYDDAAEFCRKLSTKEGKTYRLPTEAEWEHACRAATTTKYHFGDDASLLRDYAWFEDNAYNTNEKYAHQVGQKKPNGWGLYDMHGNVYEWCYDWLDAEFYAHSRVDDPSGVAAGSERVIRGGGWSGVSSYCRSAHRGNYTPSKRIYYLGFRVVLVP